MTFEEQVLHVLMQVDNGDMHPDKAYYEMLRLFQEEYDKGSEADGQDSVQVPEGGV